MVSSKGQIRLALFAVAFISLGASFLSLSYMNRIVSSIEQIAERDAKIAEVGEEVSIRMLEARREEKNFIIYLDTTYIDNNRMIQADIRERINQTRELSEEAAPLLDSIHVLLMRYDSRIEQLINTFEENPRTLYQLQRKIINYEEELKTLAKKQKIDVEAIRSPSSEVNLSLLSASTQLSTEKARLFYDLREISNQILSLSKLMSENARASLSENSQEGIRYGLKAQRNTFTLLLIALCLLLSLIILLPKRIFQPYSRMTRALKAISRGDTDALLPTADVHSELSELSRSFQQAIKKLKLFNDLKSDKIVEIERNLRRILQETDEPVIILNSELKINLMNQTALDLFELNSDVESRSFKEFQSLREVLGHRLEDIEHKGRFEFNAKIKKRDLRKRPVVVIPSIGKSGKVDSILVLVK